MCCIVVFVNEVKCVSEYILTLGLIRLQSVWMCVHQVSCVD